MSINKYATDDINGFAEKINNISSELSNLKMEGRVDNSPALKIINAGINKDGDIIMPSLIVPEGRKVIFQFAYDSLQQDFGGVEYVQGTNSSYLTAESSYLLWHILGINNEDPASVLITSDTWTQVASQLDNQTAIKGLTIYNGKIYGVTAFNGELFEFNGTNAWVKVASEYDGQYFADPLIVFNNKLYTGTHPDGYLLEWNGVDRWIAKASSGAGIHDLCVFNNKLYVSSAGNLYEWDGVSTLTLKAPNLNNQTIPKLIVYNNKLYGGTCGIAALYEWNGTNAWIQKAPQASNQLYIRGLAVFNFKLYASTYPDGLLFEWNDTNAWIVKATGTGTALNGLQVFNSKIYAGTYNTGQLLEWNGTNAWVVRAPQLAGQIHIWNLIELGGKLYGGTEASGLLFVWNGTGIYVNTTPWNDIELSFVAGTRRIYRTQSIFTEGTYTDLKLYSRVEEQNSTPQRRSAPYWAFWIAYEVNLK